MDNISYLTTPIYYVNAQPHLGHAYTTVVADVYTRLGRLVGRDARLQTGTDEHGDKIAQAAAAESVEPKQYADRISDMFRQTWPPLHIRYDRFIRTTDPDHIKVVQEILQKVYDAGDIYFAKYGGNYCVGCERFYTDHELVDGKCPDHQTEPVYIEEENYFFRMSKYQDWLLEHIEAHPDFIRPERYRNEVKSFLAEPLEDLCISRPKTRLTWGIDLPFDDRFVTYVWFDALINYVSGLGWPDGRDFAKYWPHAQHLIAKDILKPHGIYWPTMLRAAGIEPYQHLNVHGYWSVGESKMSKSVGNVVRPLELAQVYGPDAFRYFLMREMTFGLDANFSQDLLVERYNADLANDLGNLFSRVLNMMARYRDGLVPEPSSKSDQRPGPDPRAQAAEDTLPPLRTMDQPWLRSSTMKELSWRTTQYYQAQMDVFAFRRALEALWDLIGAANKYVVATEPWTLAKDLDQAPKLDQVLYRLCQVLADVTVMVWPVMPAVAEKMAACLGLAGVTTDKIRGGLLAKIASGQALLGPGTQTQKPRPLFPRIETDKVAAKAAKAEKKAGGKKSARPQTKPRAELVAIEDFARLDLRVGVITEAGPIEGADKLLRLMVDLGEDAPRQLVAGVAAHYSPQELVGMRVVVVANLKPAKLRGVMSHGMLLAGSQGKTMKILQPDPELPPGAKIK